MLKIKPIILVLILSAVLLEGVHVYLSNRIAGTSIEVAQLREKIGTLEEKNATIKSELLEYSSLYRIASRAGELGFIDAKDVIVLSSPLEVASLR